MKNLIALTNKKFILQFSFFMIFTLSCNKKNNTQDLIKFYLTNDSIQLWDTYTFSNDQKISYSFDKFGRCEFYGLGIDGIRRIYPYDSIPNEYGVCNRWKLINDSTLNIMCYEEYRILSYREDSIILKKLNKPGKDKIIILRKVKGNWNIDRDRMQWRDSIIEAEREQRKIYETKIKSGEIKVITAKADD